MQWRAEIASQLLLPTLDNYESRKVVHQNKAILFRLAVTKGHVGLICQLAKLGLPLEAQFPGHGRKTALHIAAMNNHAEMVEHLLAMGVETEALDDHGHAALHLAVINNHTGVTKQLVAPAPGVHANLRGLERPATTLPANSPRPKANLLTSSGETALHIAAKKGYAETAAALVLAGANCGARDKDGNMPIHLAAANGNTQTLRALIDGGADVEAQDRHYLTALHLAASNGHLVTVGTLVEGKADLEAHDTKGHTALLLAVLGGFISVVSHLLKTGASLEARNADGNTSLHLAVGTGHEGIVEKLVTEGANLQATNTRGDTALLLAARLDFRTVARLLLDAGANADSRDKDGHSPLAVASKKGNGELCCELVNNGAEVDDAISFFAPLGNAADAGDIHLLSRLVQIGALVKETDEHGFTVLHSAVSHAQLDVAKWIIEHGADVSASTATGWTPLHSAAIAITADRQKQIAIMKLLLVKGADPFAANAQSQTPRDVAKERSNYIVADFLKRAQLAYQLTQAGGEAKPPRSVAIRFGGPPGAGKSTLTKALQVTRWRSYTRYENQPDEGAANMQQRTKGINCQSFLDEKSAHFTIFDLGGHGEFLATHQMFIGDGSVPVIDCVVVSAQDDNFEGSAFKWCSLFASRNQPTDAPWPLLLIATRADKAAEQEKRVVLAVHHKIKQTFREQFRFPLKEPLFVDARKSWSELTVCLRKVLNQLHQELVSHDDSPRQPAICQRITEHLPALRKETSSPVVTKQKFMDYMLPRLGLQEHSDVDLSKLTSLFDKALKYLSGYATVLSFRQGLAQRHVVINPQWLLQDIVGRLMAESPLPKPYVHYENGYAETSDVVAALETEHLPGREALEMVADLGFCLEQVSLNTVLNPSKLLGYRSDKQWESDPAMSVNAGRRLKCKGTVAIASAFFPHLQVHFYHRYLSDYDEKLPMWMGGIRLVAGKCSPVEALLESDPANCSLDIIVRGKQGSERECSDLLHSLTEETLLKANDVCPGSQLCLFFLSTLELDFLSPAGLRSRPQVEYSEERVLWAVRHEQHLTDGKGSRPENPDNLLLPRLLHDQKLIGEQQPNSAKLFAHSLPIEEWRTVLLRVAYAINTFDECRVLAKGLQLNRRGEDKVLQLQETNPHRSPSEVAFSLFNLWLQRDGALQTTEQRRTMLNGVFMAYVRRSNLCGIFDDELRTMHSRAESNTEKSSQCHDVQDSSES